VNLTSMFHTADDQGECSAEIEQGFHVEQLRASVESEGYILPCNFREASSDRPYSIIRKTFNIYSGGV